MLELRDKNRERLAKIGVYVLSYHRLAPYPGWDSFKPEINRVIEFLFGAFESFHATRLGFRYINAFTAEHHGVSNVGDLNYAVNVAGQRLQDPQNLNYRRTRSENHTVQVRIASPEFVSGTIGKVTGRRSINSSWMRATSRKWQPTIHARSRPSMKSPRQPCG